MPSDDRSPLQRRGLRFFNRVLYARLPGVYDAFDTLTFGVWWRLVRRALDHVPTGGHVLEVGFGPGKLLVRLARRADVAVGLDLAWGMCAYTRDRLAQRGLPPLVTQGNVFDMPYAAGTFDTVVSTFAFSGFPDGQLAMNEMTRVLSPGGRLVLIDIGLPADGNPVGTFWARLWEKMGDFLYDIPALMTQAGLHVTLCDEFGPGNHIRAVVGQK